MIVTWRPLLIGLGAYALLMSGYVAWRAERSTDFRDFWRNARAFLEHGVILSGAAPEGPAPGAEGSAEPREGREPREFPESHEGRDSRVDREDREATGAIDSEEPAAAGRFEGVHNYLPFFTLFMAPWGLFPLKAAIIGFTLLSLALFCAAVVLIDVLIQGRLTGRPSPATLVAVGLVFPYAHACVTVGSLGLLLLFLVVAGWFLLERRQEWVAGIAFGLAALVKLLPLALVGYCLLRGRWRAAGGAAAVLAGIGLGLPLLAVGPQAMLNAHAAFSESVREHSAWSTIFADAPQKTKFNNNALPMVLRRLLSPLNANPQEARPALHVNIADWPRAAIAAAYLLLAGLIAVLSLWAGWRGASEPAFAVWSLVMLLGSPLVWTHYLPLAYPGLAVLAVRWQQAAEQRRRVPWPVGLALLVWLLAIGLLAWPAARGAGAQLAALLAVWGALVWSAMTWDAQRPAGSSSADSS